jgi:hypothetical protein
MARLLGRPNRLPVAYERAGLRFGALLASPSAGRRLQWGRRMSSFT